MKTIVLGIGNIILGDDGVGIHVARQIKKRVKNPKIIVDEAVTGGMNLLDLIVGYDKAVIIDAVKSDKAKKGDVKKIPLSSFTTMHSCNPHDVSLMEAIEMAKKLGQEKIPSEIIIIGVMMKKIPCEFSEELSKDIRMTVPKAIELTLNEIKKDNKIKI